MISTFTQWLNNKKYTNESTKACDCSCKACKKGSCDNCNCKDCSCKGCNCKH